MHHFFPPIFVIAFHFFHLFNHRFINLAVQMDLMLFLLFCFIGCIILYVIIRILIKLLRCIIKSSRSTLECPFAIKWEIDEAKLVALKDSEDGFLETEWLDASNIPDVQYQMRIYPNGNSEKTRGDAWMFLQIALGKETKLKAVFELSIESAGFISYKFHEYVSSYGLGIKCSGTSCFFYVHRFIANGKLTIKCQGIFKVQRKYQSTRYKSKWNKGSVLGNFWNGTGKDFKIVVDGKTIEAHRYILAARSPVFEAMFNSGMKESIENQMEIIDFTYEIVEAALELLYDRKISTLTMEEKMILLQFFDKYAILDLKDSCEASLVENISTSSVRQITNYSIATENLKLQKRCHDFMVACLRMNRTIDEFELLVKDFAFKVLKDTFHHVTKT